MLKRLLKIVLGFGLVVYIGIGAYLYAYQKQFLYHPSADIKTDYSGFVLKQKDAKVYVHVLNKGHENAILYFGADSESMANSSDYIAQQFPNFTCYLMDYRSFGSSTGEPSEVALYKDALSLYDAIKLKHKRISIGGRSLGSGIATYVAAHREVSKLALITPYDSIVSVAQERYPFYPVSLLLSEKYDSLSRVKNIKAATFIVMAENDRVITKAHTQKLINAFEEEQVSIAVIKNRGHIDISSDERYYKIMQDFIGDG